ncbi:GNAT family N-acetyltransferase [Iningainema tapete]|uniref:GNAT family N-acetyltransferase n=1 Tax=Iningainema tapete BLCC-T55 TaxID=2748662 RepID=A0A8J6XGV9_9CYAN|nr:GNAT family N-acetyltransferase [Iningainema tapete BLCC-T55]
MKTVFLHAKDDIEAFLRRNTYLHLYYLGDLDDFFWQYTTWYALEENQKIKQLVLLYCATSLPVLLGFSEEPTDLMKLLQSIIHLLPKQFYAHLSGDVATVFANDYQIQSHGLHYKMALTDTSPLQTIDTSNVVPLSVSDVNDLNELYRVSYPGNWFEPRMLNTGYYYGIRDGATIISVAGVHVYSAHYKVAALGNITTHPLFRGKGLAKLVCAKLCQALLQTVDHIGLNVKADNTTAISCYRKLGFEIVAAYEEYSLLLKRSALLS